MARPGHGSKKVPARISRTPRRAAEGVWATGRSGSWPIGDLYHARLALIYAMSPGHADVRKKVMRSVAKEYPRYDWAAYWDREVRQGRSSRDTRGRKGLKPWNQTLGAPSRERRRVAANPRRDTRETSHWSPAGGYGHAGKLPDQIGPWRRAGYGKGGSTRIYELEGRKSRTGTPYVAVIHADGSWFSVTMDTEDGFSTRNSYLTKADAIDALRKARPAKEWYEPRTHFGRRVAANPKRRGSGHRLFSTWTKKELIGALAGPNSDAARAEIDRRKRKKGTGRKSSDAAMADIARRERRRSSKSSRRSKTELHPASIGSAQEAEAALGRKLRGREAEVVDQWMQALYGTRSTRPNRRRRNRRRR